MESIVLNIQLLGGLSLANLACSGRANSQRLCVLLAYWQSSTTHPEPIKEASGLKLYVSTVKCSFKRQR